MLDFAALSPTYRAVTPRCSSANKPGAHAAERTLHGSARRGEAGVAGEPPGPPLTLRRRRDRLPALSWMPWRTMAIFTSPCLGHPGRTRPAGPEHAHPQCTCTVLPLRQAMCPHPVCW